MIEQPATVAAAQARTVWVSRPAGAAPCAACAAGTGCGAGWLLRVFGGRRPAAVPVAPSGAFAVGDRVVLSIPERWLLLAAGAVYGAPLAGLILGATLGELLAGSAGAMLAGCAGFVAGAAAAWLLGHRLARACPVRVRAAGAAAPRHHPLRS